MPEKWLKKYISLLSIHNKYLFLGKLDSFLDRNASMAIKVKRLEKITDTLEKDDHNNIDNKHSTAAPLGNLRFIPKKNIAQLDHRPIVHSYPTECVAELDEIKKSLKCLTKTFQIGRESDLYEKWKTFTENNKKKKLYGK